LLSTAEPNELLGIFFTHTTSALCNKPYHLDFFAQFDLFSSVVGLSHLEAAVEHIFTVILFFTPLEPLPAIPPFLWLILLHELSSPFPACRHLPGRARLGHRRRPPFPAAPTFVGSLTSAVHALSFDMASKQQRPSASPLPAVPFTI
jgi:hypothetical protein